jgi:hypothetical protein
MERIKTLRGIIDNLSTGELVSELIDLAYEYELDYLVEDIISTEDIDYFIEKRLKSGGWQGVACCLAKINYLNDDYYEIDGYGNLKEFTFNDAKKLLDYIEEEINNQEEEG